MAEGQSGNFVGPSRVQAVEEVAKVTIREFVINYIAESGKYVDTSAVYDGIHKGNITSEKVGRRWYIDPVTATSYVESRRSIANSKDRLRERLGKYNALIVKYLERVEKLEQKVAYIENQLDD